MKKFVIAAALAFGSFTTTAGADEHLAWQAPAGASIYFINLKDGDTVSSPVLIQMGAKGIGVAPAGTEREGTGHHHLLINRAPLGEGPDGEEEWLYGLPADENHVHFGGGQTEVTVELPAGTHTLQLAMGDMNHVPFGPQMTTEQITITVK